MSTPLKLTRLCGISILTCYGVHGARDRRSRARRYPHDQAGQVRDRARPAALQALGFEDKASFVEKKLYLLRSYA